MMETMISPQVGMRFRTKKEAIKKRKGPNKKMREGTMLLSFTTLELQSSTMIFIVERLSCYHFHILVGIFHYRTWLVYSNNGPPQVP